MGSRVIRPGDILTADQLARMTFVPLRTEVDQDAAVSYLPIYNDHVAQEATMTIAIRQSTSGTLRSPILRVDYAGEQDHALVELSDCLPAELYKKET